MTAQFPNLRLQRLRQTPAIRQLLSPPQRPAFQQMIYPIFLVNGTNQKVVIDAMPGQFRYSLDQLEKAIMPLVEKGVAGVILFPVPDANEKSDFAEHARQDTGLIPQAIQLLRQKFPHLIVMTDVCICAYTPHGHCGILTPSGHIDNDATLPILADIALIHAQAGAHCVAPSAMMDGQISAIRATLEAHQCHDTLLMAYATKFASAFYGPFRDAAGSAPSFGDRKSYQCDPANGRVGLLEAVLDEAEGADILMVKPALAYLDIISQLRQRTLLPISAYNVSGEYSMICATSERGWGDRDAMAWESLTAIQRAGADFILSYWPSVLN